MYDLKVDAQAVVQSAIAIEKSNADIESAFDQLDRAINTMNNNWDGSAGDCAVDAFRNLERRFRSPRKVSVDNVVRFLKQTVAESYSDTEAAMTEAAAQFI